MMSKVKVGGSSMMYHILMLHLTLLMILPKSTRQFTQSKMMSVLNKIIQWNKSNNIKLNKEKCNYLYNSAFYCQKSFYELKVCCAKYSGIIFDKKLHFIPKEAVETKLNCFIYFTTTTFYNPEEEAKYTYCQCWNFTYLSILPTEETLFGKPHWFNAMNSE